MGTALTKRVGCAWSLGPHLSPALHESALLTAVSDICAGAAFDSTHVVLSLIPQPPFDSRVDKRKSLASIEPAVPLWARLTRAIRTREKSGVIDHVLFDPLTADRRVSDSYRNKLASGLEFV